MVKLISYFLPLIPGILFIQFLSAQEPVIPPFQKDDSLKMSAPGLYEPGLNLSTGKPDFLGFSETTLHLTRPSFDFSGYLRNRWKVDYTFDSRFLIFPAYAPFFTFPATGRVFNQAVFQATDRLKMGGNSYGINSLLRAPLLPFSAGNYEYRGMSLFMEYKVSKNFRIGGSISVAGNPYQP